MSAITQTSVTLRIRGDALKPGQVSMVLGCQPDVSAAKGGAWRTPGGVERISGTGLWHKGVERRSPGDLDGQIVELLALMTDDLSAWRRLTAQFTADVFCGLFLDEVNQGLALSPTVLLAVGARGLKLDLDVYGLAEGR